MKDLPHHIKQLNRKVIRSIHRDEFLSQEMPDIPAWPETERQKKKKAKKKKSKERQAKVAKQKTPDERNKEMKKGRVPVFDRNSAEPKHTRSSKKKTPKI